MKRAALILVLLGCLVAPQAVQGHSLVRPGNGLVSYLSEDATSLNTLTVRPDGARIEFHDPTVDGGIDPGPCTPGALAGGFIIQVFCPAAGVQRVRLDLGEREDSALVTAAVPASVLGGPGADKLTAGPLGDEVAGDEGDDALDGGAGDDLLDGGPGADSIVGGPGADTLLARDGIADSISCGDGADQVDADTLDQVDPSCEAVTRTFTPSPSGSAGDEPGPPKVEVGAVTTQSPGGSRRIEVVATTSEPGALSASGFFSIDGLSRPVQVKRREIAVGGAGAILSYRVPKARWERARRALSAGRKVSLRLGVVATDLAGNTSKRRAPRVRVTLGSGDGGAAKPVGAGAVARHPEPSDVDGDEVKNEVDNCPTVKNGSQINTDLGFTPTTPAPAPPEPAPPTPMPSGDANGDACDPDDDADGVNDVDGSGARLDNCRFDRNPAQLDDLNFPGGYGDVCPPIDTDGDGVIDDEDNCDTTMNPGQADLDSDDKGDVCDTDDDDDTIVDAGDLCPRTWSNPQVDLNGDGIVNWRDQSDRDGDGIGSECDADEPAIVPPGGKAPPDTTPPEAKARASGTRRIAQLEAGIIVRITCSEACTTTSELAVSRAVARRLDLGRDRILARGSAELDGAGSTYAFLRAGAATRRAIARAGGIRARLETGIVDRAGNPVSVGHAVVLGSPARNE